MRTKLFIVFLLLISIPVAGSPVVRMFVFRSPECNSCEAVKEYSLQNTAKRAGCRIELRYFNIDNLSDYKKLSGLEKKYKDINNEMPVIVCGKKILGGENEIKSKLESLLHIYSKSGGCDWPDVIESPAREVSVRHPVALLDKKSIDAGKMLPGTEKWVSIKLKNTGMSDLKILGVRSACPCYKPRIPDKTVAPNKHIDIKIHLQPAEMSGRIDKYIMLDTNDPDRPTLRIRISVYIPAVIKATPDRISFSYIRLGKSIEKTISAVTSSKNIKAESTSSSIQIISTSKKENVYRIKIRIKGNASGRLIGRINLISSKPDCRTSVVVFGNVLP